MKKAGGINMRLRHNRVKPLERVLDSDDTENGLETNQEKKSEVREAKPVDARNEGLIRRIINNPNLAFQIMVIVLTLASDNLRMDRRIDTMTTKIDSIRGIAEVINNTMQSVKVAAEAPKHIRKLLQ